MQPLASPDGHGLRAATAVFQTPTVGASLSQLAVSIGSFVATCAVMYVVVDLSILVTLGLALIASGFLVRIFIIQHDCGHGSYFRSRAANTATGILCSLMTMTPYAAWRRQHAGHHGTWNDLDRRQSGVDIYSTCLTVAEYRALSSRQRRWHRLARHPLVANVLLPPLIFVLLYRVPFDTAKGWNAERRAVYVLNGALAMMFVALGLALGFGEVALVQLPVIMAASIIGVWLFSIQHRFETTLWTRHNQWTPRSAALQGSSYLRLPGILQWFTGNIGLHHVHHLNTRIPNYRLQPCLDSFRTLQEAPAMSLGDGIKATWLALWDEERGKMVTFREAMRGVTGAPGPKGGQEDQNTSMPARTSRYPTPIVTAQESATQASQSTTQERRF